LSLHAVKEGSALFSAQLATYVDGHDWERVSLETPIPARSTVDTAPREMRKQEHVPINTDIDLDPKFDTFQIFLPNLDSQDQDK
jgi:hypothetical protein